MYDSRVAKARRRNYRAEIHVEIKHLFDFMRCSCQANQDTAGPESDAPPLPSTY